MCGGEGRVDETWPGDEEMTECDNGGSDQPLMKDWGGDPMLIAAQPKSGHLESGVRLRWSMAKDGATRFENLLPDKMQRKLFCGGDRWFHGGMLSG
jgi:hypothetical protein